ncbi:hypothetical protein AXX17_AT1G42690 [Arabidopsis thaliana]|uniref:Uncharacterized protein n=1 Tax=Arabidopsis thaliana TaxID=3702 RepID=A0A178WNR5_ARATH|nr:hypothetical protein AXX17_AT1G42690 [Arabidopsis thaliana]
MKREEIRSSRKTRSSESVFTSHQVSKHHDPQTKKRDLHTKPITALIGVEGFILSCKGLSS